MTSEPSGANCALGGLRVDTGLDSNDDGTLESAEIQHTAYVCAVAAGDGGAGADAAPTDAGSDTATDVPQGTGGTGGTGGTAGAGGGGGTAGAAGGGGAVITCASSPGALIDLGTLAGDSASFGLAIDDRGNVLAAAAPNPASHPFFWHTGTATPLIGTFGLALPVGMNRSGRALGMVGGGCPGASCYALWDAPSPNPTATFGVTPQIDTLSLAFVGDNGAPFATASVQRGCIACMHAITWPPSLGTAFIDLGTIDGVITTGSTASAANSLGQVVGTSGGRAVLWAPSIGDLGNLGAGGAAGVDINDATEVAGTSSTASGAKHAFLWRAGVMQDLGTLNPGGSSEAIAINAAADVVGNSGGHAVLWRAGTIIDLGTLGGASSTAVGLNDAGQVAGNSQTAAGSSHAFLWSGGVMTDLGTLGGATSSAKAINASGRVVGTSTTAGGNSRAFVACPADSSTGSP